MGNMDVLDVRLNDLTGSPVRGFSLEGPRPGCIPAEATASFEGWIVGDRQPVIAVELCLESAVLHRAAVHLSRSDVAAAHSGLPGAATSGFSGKLALLNRHFFELQVRAVLRDHSRVPLATLAFRRLNREIMNGMPLVSVVIPCYRQAHFLSDAIESVLSQTYAHIEIIVIDDGSPDNTAEVISRYPDVRFHRQANAGLAAARNTGLRLSRGEYLIFLDSDDRLLPNAASAGLAALSANSDAAFTFGRFQFITMDRSAYAAPQPPHVKDGYDALLQRNYIAMHSTVLFRRSALELVNGFDPAMKACEDYDLYLRIARTKRFCRHDGLVAEYRQHGDNMTKNAGLMLRYAVTALVQQRDHALRNETTTASYHAGMKYWRDYYGQHLTGHIQSCWHRRDLRAAFHGITTLLRYDPARFWMLATGRQPSAKIGESRNETRVARERREAARVMLACPECQGRLSGRTSELKCSSCGVCYPQPSDMWFDLIPRSFLKNDATRWESRQIEMEEWYRSLVANPQATAEMFERDYGPYRPYLQSLSGTVLDLGGGAGITRHFLKSEVRTIVLDPSTSWLERSWRSLAGVFPCLEEPMTFVRGVGECLPFANGSFDAVVSFWSLNHASDPDRVFREVHRVLRPGGQFLAVLEDIPEDDAAGIPASLGDDHIPIDVADLATWIHGRYSIQCRRWVQGTAANKYLTFELVRERLPAEPSAPGKAA